MYELYVWVPAKGWKRILGTNHRQRAIDMMNELHPLEVRVSCPDGRTIRVNDSGMLYVKEF